MGHGFPVCESKLCSVLHYDVDPDHCSEPKRGFLTRVDNSARCGGFLGAFFLGFCPYYPSVWIRERQVYSTWL
ncbi:hypothetical protein F2Q69_00027294 [Brassica cretica]|uniref:Uncharacterized protein n=1 Tax=Brassica cretica TaxID=69181 RepID=A0A8S9RSW6_BRACR|nr:hypothetical protein F2Q69_00027294 [Brassica cretica]